VALQHAEEHGQIPADVVDHLQPGRTAPTEEDAAHADKGLGIGDVVGRIDQLRDPLC
jgi:hypothetical protein